MKSETVEIGNAETKELDAVLEILCEAFQMPPDAARPVFYNDPYFKLENKRVLRVNGRVVSCLTIVERECGLGYSTVKLGGIAGVATRSDFRNRGYAGRLLADTVGVLRARGFGLSALIPARQEFYRRYGWEVASHGYRYLTVPAHLPIFPERQNVRPARQEDIPLLMAMYDQWTDYKTLHCRRDAKRWQYILDNVKQRMVYVTQDGTATGYLLYDFVAADAGGAKAEPDGATLPPPLRILEMYAHTGEAQHGLIGYLASQTQGGCIEYTTSLSMFTNNGLHGVRGGNKTLDALASIEIVPALMARVIDPLILLKQMRKDELYGIRGKLQIEIGDPLAVDGMTGALIDGSGKTPNVRPLDKTSSGPTVERIQGDVRVWSQVLTGHLSACDACALGLLQPLTEKARELAENLFLERYPFLPLTDHF